MSDEYPDGRVVRVLSLGAGVQSTAIYLMANDAGDELTIDAAVFADTGDEPRTVYRHLEWLESLGGPPIYRGSVGVHLSASLVAGMNSTGGRFVSIPAHLQERKRVDGLFGKEEITRRRGMQRRQCTQEFKIRIIGQTIRRRILGLAPGRPIPSGVRVVQYIGFSTDEPGRAARHGALKRPRGWSAEFPLIARGMDRDACVRYLRERVPHEVERSACVFCPYRSNDEWRRLRDTDPEGFARAVAVDAALRDNDSAATRNMSFEMYVHASRVALDVVDFGKKSSDRFHEDCVGGCGL